MAILLVATLSVFPQTGRIVILHTNDTHSQIEPFAPNHKTLGGMAGVVRRMALIDSIRSVEPNVLLVDAGDAIQGTPYFNLFGGEAEFEVMNAMRYDVRTLGNHEFDARMEKLAELIKNSTARFISSNYDLSNTPLAGLIQPWAIQEVGGYKVGFLALNVNPENLIPAEACKGVVFHECRHCGGTLPFGIYGARGKRYNRPANSRRHNRHRHHYRRPLAYGHRPEKSPTRYTIPC